MRTAADVDPEARFDAFQRRWDLAWSLIPYPLVPVATLLALTTGGSAPPVLLVGVAVAALGWHFWFVSLHPHWPERKFVPMAVYFVGFLGLATTFASLHPAGLLIMVCCFALTFVALPGGWAYPGVAATVACTLVIVGGLRFDPGLVVQVAIGGLLAAGIGAAIRWVEREAVRRRAAHAELSRAHADLVRLTEEKRRLDTELIKVAEQAGVTRERARMARALHDTQLQHLIAIGAQLEAASELLEPGHAAAAPVRAALQVSRDGLVDARRAVDALRPPALDDRELADAIRTVVASWRRFHRIPVELTVTGTETTPSPPVAEAAVRVVGEALANVARHAGATRVDVSLAYLDDVIVIDVNDDGAGFRVGESTGFGLRSMRDRVAEVGGTLAVESTPGAGTVVAVTLPIGGTGAAG
ncbi:sensor histidine kinase [Microlunatus parietis]|uniref:Oxygen sensor histidine kinase NreB n=1 Tax=Microlunatus parietis TaxID=682979 RepID=A0A7Y9I566_9ACTN|nr:sensor histidine kinase [Microlunatus parietis]NYE70407.1 signal transduction histidine kinase [Microlunatus parietis]